MDLRQRSRAVTVHRHCVQVARPSMTVLLLVPRIDTAAPTVSTSASQPPPNVAAASASGVCDCASPGSVPSENGRAHVRTPVTNGHLVCRFPLEKNIKESHQSQNHQSVQSNIHCPNTHNNPQR